MRARRGTPARARPRRLHFAGLLLLPLSAGCGFISWFTDTDPIDGVGYRWVCHADEEEAWTGEWRRVSSGASVVLHQGHGDPVSIWEQPVGAECER